MKDTRKTTWKEYDLVQQTSSVPYRREITWSVFDEKANRVANMLLSRGVQKGDRVAILMFNCLEWLPIYFGILKTGAIAVPFNFRFASDEIKYCADLAEVHVLFFGPEFIGRIEAIEEELSKGRLLIYVGDGCPTFAESYRELVADCSSQAPLVRLEDEDDAAIYFSSGTTGFPKAILHNHESLLQAAQMEQKHHLTNRDDVFLCIPPLYHTGAKFHWMGSLCAGSKAVLLKGTTPEIILDAVSKEHCTIVWLLVPWAQDILDSLDRGDLKLENYELSQWRLMHIGAQPVPPSLIKHWKEYFPNHLYDTNYGLSESTGPGCVHLGIENIDKVGAIGIPGYRWSCKIVDENGNATLWLSPSEDFVDLTQYIYESIVLSLPYQRVHPDGECDPDMLGRFRIVSEQEFETIENETQQREREGSGSGQWTEQLSAIKQQMEQEEKDKKH